jgi:hypothetical protein
MKSAGNHFAQYAWSSRKWSVENGTIPASSQGLPTSRIRSTGPPHDGQAMVTASTQGRCGVCPSNASQPPTARSRSSSRPPMTSMVPHAGQS